MPSPFPGMDPFLEGQLWRDFHHTAISVIREALVPWLAPRYVVEVGEWIDLDGHVQGYLELRRRGSAEVVTAIELLSTTNKSSRSGHQEYLARRAVVLHASASLVEIDLLRGGTRLPTAQTPPAGDFYAYVTCGTQLAQLEVYLWSLRNPLPTIPVPLVDGDADTPLNLAAILTTVYDRSGYRDLVDYSRPVEPPLSEADERWTQEILRRPRD